MEKRVETDVRAYDTLIELIQDSLHSCSDKLDKDVASASTYAERACVLATRLVGCLAFEQGKTAALATKNSKKSRKSKKKAL